MPTFLYLFFQSSVCIFRSPIASYISSFQPHNVYFSSYSLKCFVVKFFLTICHVNKVLNMYGLLLLYLYQFACSLKHLQLLFLCYSLYHASRRRGRRRKYICVEHTFLLTHVPYFGLIYCHAFYYSFVYSLVCRLSNVIHSQNVTDHFTIILSLFIPSTISE